MLVPVAWNKEFDNSSRQKELLILARTGCNITFLSIGIQYVLTMPADTKPVFRTEKSCSNLRKLDQSTLIIMSTLYII